MSGTRLQRLASALVSVPWIYDLVQRLTGQGIVAGRLRTMLRGLPQHRILDLGSSGGGFAARLGLSPVFLDVDPRPLLAMRRRGGAMIAVAGDGARLPFPDAAFDLTLCLAVFHHVDDAALRRVVSEIARVTSGNLVLFEPLRSETRWISRFLWRYDRGRHPRTREELTEWLEADFHVSEVVEFALYHRYVICIAQPLPRARTTR